MKNEFTQVDFGAIQEYLDNDDVTDISYSNGGQVWLKTLSKGVFRVENPAVNNAFMEKMAFQCANSMGKSFNMANPFLDAESDELRMNFVHESIARNGIAVLIRKTPAKIRLEKDKILKEDYYDKYRDVTIPKGTALYHYYPVIVTDDKSLWEYQIKTTRVKLSTFGIDISELEF